MKRYIFDNSDGVWCHLILPFNPHYRRSTVKKWIPCFGYLTCQSLEWIIQISNIKFVTHALHSNIGVFYPRGTYKTTSADRAYSATPVKVILVLPEDPKPLYLKIQPALFSLWIPLSFDTKPNAVNLAFAMEEIFASQANRRCSAEGSCSPHFLQLICQW